MSDVLFLEKKGIRGGTVGGIWYPSTSAVLDLIHPTKMEFIAQEDLDRGSRCHAEVASWLRCQRDRLDWFPEMIDAGELVCVTAIQDWLQHYLQHVLHVEQTLFSSTFKFVGTPDAVIEAGRSTLDYSVWTIDLKFAESIDKRYVDQIESYVHFPETAGSRRLILQCKKNGDVKPHWIKPNPRGWAAFQAARNVLEYRVSL